MAGRKYSTRYAKFQVSGYASRGGTRFGANEKTYLKKYFFGYVFRSRYVFFCLQRWSKVWYFYF